MLRAKQLLTMSVFFALGAGLGKSTQVRASLGKSAVSTGASREAPVDNECFFDLGAGLGKSSTTRNANLQAIGGRSRQVYASLGKWATTRNPDLQAIGAWAEQV